MYTKLLEILYLLIKGSFIVYIIILKLVFKKTFWYQEKQE